MEPTSPQNTKNRRILFNCLFEHETPKLIKVKSTSLGVVRLIINALIITFIIIYELWYARGYQKFEEIESSLTTKVKGLSM